MGGHRIRFGEKNGKCFVENDMVTIVNILDSTHTHTWLLRLLNLAGNVIDFVKSGC